MFRCWMVLALVAALWAGRAEAAELTGFGPIKFGMTKEQAQAALETAGIEGEWENEGNLLYDYPLSGRSSLPLFLTEETLKIEQGFRDGRAGNVGIDFEWYFLSRSFCVSEVLFIIAAISNKYNKVPIIASNLPGRSVLADVSDTYVFPFDDESLIQVTMTSDFVKKRCSMFIWYHAPVPDPIPF